MIEDLIRNLDHKTTKSLAITIKAVLSDHIRFIRDINRTLILNGDGNSLFTNHIISVHHQSFRGWGKSYRNTALQKSNEFKKVVNLHLKLQTMAEQISMNFRRYGKIDIIEYEKFLNENDIFFEFLWELANEVISAQYQFDPLTKLLNRRAFSPILLHELSKVNRLDYHCSLVMVDLDDFKKINDNFGHDVGDVILSEFASVLLNCLREIDCASRYGGEEFLLCLPDTDVNKAYTVIERLNQYIKAFEFSSNIQLTASFGVSLLQEDIKSSIINADRAMYQSKNNGKNKITIYVEQNQLF